jgi:hypothetical protein
VVFFFSAFISLLAFTFLYGHCSLARRFPAKGLLESDPGVSQDAPHCDSPLPARDGSRTDRSPGVIAPYYNFNCGESILR